jgi:hypothetical protein
MAVSPSIPIVLRCVYHASVQAFTIYVVYTYTLDKSGFSSTEVSLKANQVAGLE